jgi:homoserine dehydrogenase
LKLGLNFRTVAIVDSEGAAISRNGLNLATAVEVKNRCNRISEWKPHGISGTTTLDVLETIDVDLLIETTPNNIEDGEPGLSNIASALSKGIDVITTNKAPIALALHPLKEIAARNGSQLRYSGTVGGGMPILDFATHQLANENILSAQGILNATSNYILWKMSTSFINFEDALTEARGQGIAETNPCYDIKGFDTACKLVIIANSVMNRNARLQDVKIQGIDSISLKDVLEAEEQNGALRLVGRIENELTVSLETIKRTDRICVEADYNSIRFLTDYGDYTLIGRGAGGRETANAVIRDLVDILRLNSSESRAQRVAKTNHLLRREYA